MENVYVISGVDILEKAHFNDYRGQPIVDLTKSSCSYIPKWLGDFRNIQKLILDENSARWSFYFEKGFSETIQIEIQNMTYFPNELTCPQVVGGEEFINNLMLTQDGGEEYLLNDS
jgi:hypothetical protein